MRDHCGVAKPRDLMDQQQSWDLSDVVNHCNFLSRVEVLRLGLTSKVVARALNWIVLCRNEDPPTTLRRPRRGQLPLVRPRRPITFALCRLAGLDEKNATAFRRFNKSAPLCTVVTWGAARDEDQHDDPPTEANFVAIACGRGQSVALRADGTVVTWGRTNEGQHVDAPTDANFVAISCGYYHSVGLRADGTVVTWGRTRNGQRNDAPTDSNFVAVACGAYHNCGIRETRHLRG